VLSLRACVSSFPLPSPRREAVSTLDLGPAARRGLFLGYVGVAQGPMLPVEFSCLKSSSNERRTHISHSLRGGARQCRGPVRCVAGLVTGALRCRGAGRALVRLPRWGRVACVDSASLAPPRRLAGYWRAEPVPERIKPRLGCDQPGPSSGRSAKRPCPRSGHLTRGQDDPSLLGGQVIRRPPLRRPHGCLSLRTA
jgi:hypothetical protein